MNPTNYSTVISNQAVIQSNQAIILKAIETQAQAHRTQENLLLSVTSLGLFAVVVILAVHARAVSNFREATKGR
jgi:hypothetical protein